MTVRFVFLALLLAGAALPAAAQPSSRADLPVTVTFRSQPGDAVLGDAIGAYVDGERNVRAILTSFSEGNLVLDTNDGRKDGGRRVLLAFGGQVPGLADGAADVFMPMRSVDLMAGGDDLRTLSPGATVHKRLNINWTSGKTSYHLRWNGPENGHGFASVTCTVAAAVNAAGDTCAGWVVTSTATDLAGLYTSAAKGSYKETFVTAVAMPFEATIVVK